MTDTRLIFATKTTRTFGYGILGVMLGLYLDKSGYSPAEVGLVLSAALVGSALLTSVFAARADRLGRRRTLILSTLLMVAGGAAFALAQNVGWLIVAALTGTISATASEVGPFETVEQAMLAETVGVGERNSAFGNYSTLAALAVAGGSLFAGLTGPIGTLLRLNALDSYRLMFGVYAALGLATMVLFRLMSDRVEVHGAAPAAAASRPAGAALGGLRRSRGFVLKLAALFSVDAFGGGFVLQSIIAYWFGKQFGAGPEIVGPVFFANNLIKALSFPVAVRLADRFGLINTMVWSHVPSNVLLMMMAFVPTLPAAVAVLFARQMLSQMDVPTRAAYIAGIVPAEERTAANGVINVSRQFAQAAGPALAGPIASALASVGAAFVLGGLIKIVYDLSLYALFKDVHTPEEMERLARGQTA